MRRVKLERITNTHRTSNTRKVQSTHPDIETHNVSLTNDKYTINWADEVFTDKSRKQKIHNKNSIGSHRQPHTSAADTPVFVCVFACMSVWAKNIKNKTKHKTGFSKTATAVAAVNSSVNYYYFLHLSLVHLADYLIHLVHRAHRNGTLASLWCVPHYLFSHTNWFSSTCTLSMATNHKLWIWLILWFTRRFVYTNMFTCKCFTILLCTRSDTGRNTNEINK